MIQLANQPEKQKDAGQRPRPELIGSRLAFPRQQHQWIRGKPSKASRATATVQYLVAELERFHRTSVSVLRNVVLLVKYCRWHWGKVV